MNVDQQGELSEASGAATPAFTDIERLFAGCARQAPYFSCPAKKSRQKKAALRLPAIVLRTLAGSLTPCNQSGEEKISARASDSFSSFTRINCILFGGTQREGKEKQNEKGQQINHLLPSLSGSLIEPVQQPEGQSYRLPRFTNISALLTGSVPAISHLFRQSRCVAPPGRRGWPSIP
ncbi:MAG: hypothetical protein AB1Z51_04060 [Desulfuromonadales bacterium]